METVVLITSHVMQLILSFYWPIEVMAKSEMEINKQT